MAIADKVAVMSHGTVVQVGPPEELYRNPRTRFVAGFVGHAVHLEGQVAGTTLRTQGGMLTLPRDGENCEVFVRAEDVAITPNGALKARVESSVFLGTHYRLGLSGITAGILYSNHAGLAAPARGTDVRISIDPSKLLLIDQSGATP